MEILNYLVAVAIIAITIQYGEVWMSLGATMVVIIASKDIKVSILLVVSFVTLYLVNGIGMNDYWMFAAMGLIALGYLLGVGADAGAAADPYAGLLGGAGGGMGF
jgi:hypothetical protein